MQMLELIKKKRDGGIHSPEELEFILAGAVNGSVKDYQLSAWLMAVYFKGLNLEETTEFTRLMVNSGETLDLAKVPGIKVDKHSTGGVGDKVTLVLAPLVASAGTVMAKISGRGLGHTGGTVDKLEAIPGFKTDLEMEGFIEQLKNVGVSVIGQTKNLTPSDKVIYGLRDVTGTVESLPLITSSILSKKIAAGTDVVLLDIKYGSGAFMKTFDDAKKLSEMLVAVGKRLNKSIVTAISDMEQPLGFTIGHTLEVIEAIETLKGKGPRDLTKICLKYGALLLKLAKKVKTLDEGEKLLSQNITNGKALAKFKAMIEAQGGDSAIIDNYDLMPKAEHLIDIISDKSGYVSKLDASAVGETAALLGAGREKKEDEIDLGVGIKLIAKVGDKVNKGNVIAVLYANNLKHIEKALKKIQEAYEYSPTPPPKIPLIREIIL